MNVYVGNRLPSTYQEVEYIASSGTQYINTGYIPTNNTKVELSMGGWSNVGTYCSFFGARYEWSDTGRGFMLGKNTNDGYPYAMFGKKYSGSSWYSGLSFWDGSNHIIVMSGNGIYQDGTLCASLSSATFTSPTDMTIFALNVNGTKSEQSSYKLYYFKIRESGTLVRDFVPCYRKSDSVIGLYDLVNNQFYTNSGTGTFSKGNDVTMSELKNAYIGEYTGFEYSYDFRNKTTSQFTADGWTAYEGTAYFDADGIYGSSGTLRNKINLQLNLTNAKKITIVENYKWTSSSAGTRTGLAVVSDMTQWNGVYLQGTARGTDLASTFNHVTNSASDATGTYQETLVIDLENKTYTVSGHWSYTVSLTDAQISSIRSTTGLYVMLYTSNYIRVQNVSLTIEY